MTLAEQYKQTKSEETLKDLLNENKGLIRNVCSFVPEFYREDAEQEATISFVKSIDTWKKDKSKFSTWATRSMKFAVTDFLRRFIPKAEFTDSFLTLGTVEERYCVAEDLSYLLKKIKKHQAKEVLNFLLGGASSHTQSVAKSIKSIGIRNLRRAFKEELNRVI